MVAVPIDWDALGVILVVVVHSGEIGAEVPPGAVPGLCIQHRWISFLFLA